MSYRPMAPPSLLLRFRLDLSDIDRSVYESLDFRIAQHPSETTDFLLTRVIAYALNYDADLKFSSGGLSDVEEPPISKPSPNGGYQLWIEIGSPAAKRMHKAMKASREVKVYTYKDPRQLVKEVSGGDIHRKQDLLMYAIDSKDLDQLAAKMEKDNRWTVLHSEGTVTISINDEPLSFEVKRLSINT